METVAAPTNKTLQEIDALIQDFSAPEIARSLQDTYEDHVRTAEGYDSDRLADEYEIITRLAAIIQERGQLLQQAKERRSEYERKQAGKASK